MLPTHLPRVSLKLVQWWLTMMMLLWEISFSSLFVPLIVESMAIKEGLRFPHDFHFGWVVVFSNYLSVVCLTSGHMVYIAQVGALIYDSLLCSLDVFPIYTIVQLIYLQKCKIRSWSFSWFDYFYGICLCFLQPMGSSWSLNVFVVYKKRTNLR